MRRILTIYVRRRDGRELKLELAEKATLTVSVDGQFLWGASYDDEREALAAARDCAALEVLGQ